MSKSSNSMYGYLKDVLCVFNDLCYMEQLGTKLANWDISYIYMEECMVNIFQNLILAKSSCFYGSFRKNDLF